MKRFLFALFIPVIAILALSIPALAAPVSNPDAIAVIVANSEYKNEIPRVDYAGNDGDAMRTFLIDVLGYRDGNVIDLRNASQAQILAVFGNERSHEGKLWSWVRPGRSDVFVYYSGHGAPGLRDRRGYLLPVDSDPATVEINGYPLDLLYRNLAKLKARSVTVLLDACFSGASERGMLIKAASPVFVKTVASDVASGITVLSAAQGDQVASWDQAAKLGLFTNYVLKGFYGEADKADWGNGDGQVTLAEVRAYLDDEMTYAARRRFTRVQQASVIGNSRAVLVPQTPKTPNQVAAISVPTPKKSAPKPSKLGLYDGPDEDMGKALALLQDHQSAIEKAIKNYYRKEGYVWDTSFSGLVQGNGEESFDHIEEIMRMRVLRAGVRNMDIRVTYSAGKHGIGDESELFTSKFLVALSATKITVSKMWK
ncbi:MAG: caspase family protein [Rhodospirillaceae bacterium]|nr:caspase family protein [Rhodospirillaceae bacterium]MBT6136396.1 caspase family protein [Rhodospirillaceae bacterium]